MGEGRRGVVVEGLAGWRPGRRPCAVAVGTFDGVHLGHRALLAAAAARGHAEGLVTVALTFEPHPAEVLRGEHGRRLSTPAEKTDALLAEGVDAVVVLAFDEALRVTEPEDFVAAVLADGLGARSVHVGYNFSFGRGGRGGAAALRELGGRRELRVHILDQVSAGGQVVSSSRIRALLDEGRVETAAELLGRPYRLEGDVVHGDGRGRGLGFPTANLRPGDGRKLLPRFGVYAGRVARPSDGSWPCLVAVGLSPTFGHRDQPRVEVHVPGLERDLYGSRLAVDLTGWIRPERRFASAGDLVAQMEDDLRHIEAGASNPSPGGRSLYREVPNA